MEKFLAIYKETTAKLSGLNLASFLSNWDSQTEAPKGCVEHRSKQMATLGQISYELSTAPAFIEAIGKLYENRQSLDELMRHEIEVAYKAIDRMKKIPQDEYVKYIELMSKCEYVYFEAKVENNYEKFKPYLAQIIEYEKKCMVWYETDTLKGYDTLLDDFEIGFGKKEYDLFFNTLREKLVPFVKKVLAQKIDFDTSFLTAKYPIEKQKEFSQYIMDVMCFDRNRGLMKESEHPFTSGNGITDVRVTVHYYEDMVLSAIFSAIHELGHATYEQQVAPELEETQLTSGASMGMHESQSRFYENIIGRSYEFWQKHYGKLQELFPEQLGKVSLDIFYKGVNLVEASLIRTEADELTYPLHIMIRYEMEKMMLEGNIDMDDLPKMWNKLYKDYLGIDVPSDKQGILQDVHWSAGLIGYFPTYALGSAYGAQIYHKMSQEIDVKKIMGSENLKEINNWLKEKIHKYGSSKYPKEILREATGEDFNPNYYVDYLIDKYSKIYNIK